MDTPKEKRDTQAAAGKTSIKIDRIVTPSNIRIVPVAQKPVSPSIDPPRIDLTQVEAAGEQPSPVEDLAKEAPAPQASSQVETLRLGPHMAVAPQDNLPSGGASTTGPQDFSKLTPAAPKGGTRLTRLAVTAVGLVAVIFVLLVPFINTKSPQDLSLPVTAVAVVPGPEMAPEVALTFAPVQVIAEIQAPAPNETRQVEPAPVIAATLPEAPPADLVKPHVITDVVPAMAVAVRPPAPLSQERLQAATQVAAPVASPADVAPPARTSPFVGAIAQALSEAVRPAPAVTPDDASDTADLAAIDPGAEPPAEWQDAFVQSVTSGTLAALRGGGNGQTPAERALFEFVATALQQGETRANIDQMLAEAQAAQVMEIPPAYLRADGRPDTTAILSALEKQ